MKVFLSILCFTILISCRSNDHDPYGHKAEGNKFKTSDGISLVGEKSITWPLGKPWTDPGYTALLDGEDCTPFVDIANFIDISQPGQYKVVYTVMHPSSGEVVDSLERLVTVKP